jgi:hypothetical protein
MNELCIWAKLSWNFLHFYLPKFRWQSRVGKSLFRKAVIFRFDRVTRLGNFLPMGQFYLWTVLSNNTEEDLIFGFLFPRLKLRNGYFGDLKNLKHFFLKYIHTLTMHTYYVFDYSTAMYNDLKTLHPGGIRTRDLLFWCGCDDHYANPPGLDFIT